MTNNCDNMVWQNESCDGYHAAQVDARFLTQSQRVKLERIRQARMLYDGRHREYFLGENRTQYPFPPSESNSGIIRLYATHNILGLISNKNADLLVGVSPTIRCEDTLQQKRLDEMIERTSLHAMLYGCALDASYEGECFIESQMIDGVVYLEKLDAASIFPLGNIQPDGQYARYAGYRVQRLGSIENPIELVLKTTWAPGSITREAFVLSKNKLSPIDLAAWPTEDGKPLEPVTQTGIRQNTITWIPNMLVRGTARSDYDGSIELQDKLNAKESQIARVLVKHSDPKLLMPTSAADEAGNVNVSNHQVFFFRSKEEIPQYLLWNAELDAAIRERDTTLRSILIRTEMSPVLLGLKEGAAPDAYKKLRLEAMNSTTKAARKAVFFKTGIRRAMTVAQALENTGTYRYPTGPISVELHDGIPIDEMDQAQTIATLRSVRAISIYRAVEMQLASDPAAVNKEMARLAEENANDTPGILSDFAPPHTSNTTSNTDSDNQTAKTNDVVAAADETAAVQEGALV